MDGAFAEVVDGEGRIAAVEFVTQSSQRLNFEYGYNPGTLWHCDFGRLTDLPNAIAFNN